MMMFLVMGACMYPMLLILYAIMRYYGKPRAGLLFGAGMQPGWEQEPEVEAIRRRFRKEMLIWLLILAVVPVVTLPIPYMSVSTSFWLIWCFGALALMEVPFARANHALRRWKAERGYTGQQEGRRLVEIRDLGELRCLRWTSFLAPTLLGFAGAAAALVSVWGRPEAFGVGSVAISFALMTPIFGWAGLWMDRQRQKVVSSDSQVNLNYNRARRMLWKKFWILMAWLTTALTVAFGGATVVDADAGMALLIWGTIGYTVVLLLLCVELLRRQNKLDSAYRDKMDLVGFSDDDACWLGGLIYYNPKDTKTMVEKRVGVGTTMNMATPGGKAMGVFLLLVLLGVLVLCAWLVRLEFTPIHLSLEGDTLVAEQLKEDYTIPLDTIEDVSLVEDLPAMVRTNGTGMTTLSKGSFRIRETGEGCQVFLNPQNDVFLRVEAGDTTYYLGGQDDQETLAVYDSLTQGQ